jgi:hypothetical protein
MPLSHLPMVVPHSHHGRAVICVELVGHGGSAPSRPPPPSCQGSGELPPSFATPTEYRMVGWGRQVG